MALDIPDRTKQGGITRIIGESGNTAEVDSSGNLGVDGDVNVTNASIPITHTGDLDVNVKNATLNVSGAIVFDGTQDVDIKNVGAISVDASGSTVPISVAGTVTVDASGATVPISHTGDLDVNMTNATMNVSGAITFDGAQDVDIITPAIDINVSGAEIVSLGLATTGFDGPRSDQTLKDFIHTYSADNTWETVYSGTAGKVYYVSSLVATNISASPVALLVSGAAITGAGKQRLSLVLPANSIYTDDFPVPIETSGALVTQTGDKAGIVSLNVIGWEE